MSVGTDCRIDVQDQQWTYSLVSKVADPPPLRSKVEKTLHQMNNGKSPRTDDIQAELWKATGEEGIDALWCLCKLIWSDEEWPKDWCSAVFILLPKKGNLKECRNYRKVILISLASKVMLRIILNRMKGKRDQENHKMSIIQAGFREGRGTRDHIVNIRNIIEKCRIHIMSLYVRH